MERTVYHDLRDLGNNPVVGATVIFELESGGYDNQSIYVESKKVVESDASGRVEASLWVNDSGDSEVCYRVHLPGCETFNFVIPSGTEPISLMALKESGISWENPKFLSTIEYIQNNAEQLGLDIITEKSYTHYQTTIASVWNVNHNLGKKPSVAIEDVDGNPVEALVSYQGLDNLTITISPPTAGEAQLN